MAADRPGTTGGRGLGLSAHLVAFALVLLLPTLGLAAAVAWQVLRDYRAAFEERLQDTARALSLALDAEIGTYRATVSSLASAMVLDGPSPDLAAFEGIARRIAAGIGTDIILVEPEGLRQLVNTALPPGTPAGGAASVEFRAAVGARRPVVSDAVTGAVSRRPVVGVAVPVERDGRLRFVLAARVEPERLSALLAAQGLGPGEFATVVDGRGVVVARSRDAAGYVGRAAPAWFAAATAGRDRGLVTGPAIGGDTTLFGFQRLSAAPNWTVVVGAPAAAHRESWRAPLRRLALGGGAALLLGTALALLLARRLTRPVAALARRARAVAAAAEGGTPEAAPPPPPAAAPSGVREIEALRTSVEAAQEALARRAAAAEREAAAALAEGERRLRLVVAELNHRAKNALATVQSLALQTARGPAGADPAEFTRAFTDRLRTLARAHDLLTAFSWEGAALGAVVRAGLAPWLDGAEGGDGGAAPAGAPRILLGGCPEDLPLPLLGPGQAQALVMALHELATNAAKHGALSVPGGRVEIGCRAGPDGAAAVEWRERDGPPVAADMPRRPGFGTRLLERALAHDLGPGARVSLDFAAEGLRATIAFVPRLAAAAA